MADITMCASLTCPFRQKCYRFKAEASIWQSYFSEPPYSNGNCKYFWPMEESKEYEDRSRHRNNFESQEDSRSSNQGH